MNLYRDIVQDAKENQCPKRNIRPLNQQTTMANHKSSVNDVINLSKIAKSAILKNFKESKSDFKRVFLIYSRLHNLYKLKHETLFLALELYRKYSLSQDEKIIPENYLQAVSLYLAMKYEEIYPPRFKNIYPHISSSIEPSHYNKYEFLYLEAIGADMDIVSGKKLIDQLLQNQPQETYFHAYYLLELCYGANIIDQPYNLTQIASSIVYSMNPFSQPGKKLQRFNEIEIQTIIDCTKLILQLKYKACVNQSVIYKKYCQSKYESAALKTIIIQKQIEQ